MRVLVTGSAGFIGFHLVKSLLERGDEVIGIDNINDYYDVNLKYARLAETGISKSKLTYGRQIHSTKHNGYVFLKLDLTDAIGMHRLFETYKFDCVCNLAAQAGVRYSLTNPAAYIESNIKGFLNVLECCRYNSIKHLLYASSSSVYGLNKKMPFSVNDNVDHPVSLYAASKKSNELMAHAYSHLFNLPTTALRFFTVYGPWGRPDMALYSFTKAIIDGEPINIFNNGKMKRDFTYIDDIIAGIITTLDIPAQSNLLWDGDAPDPASSSAPYSVFNIGRGEPLNLMDFIVEIERNVGKHAKRNYLPMQNGDVLETWADAGDLITHSGTKKFVSVKDGVKEFVKWYVNFYKKDGSKARNKHQHVL
ncbi:NAD-dependent epimerase [Pedobacter nyackensis]|uniref:UDP-glucuronate 4-epimerase n=1 Tax=Pedobacter nyackensis TaxID=475255 RepID=A0A1W2DCH3_9SPHI|nr:NAD-dependent epimerase [Pedobacter nyackensis]SMC95185.1 UDP-glucuronate 4-epimerase [Pedobacter nyackensis]